MAADTMTLRLLLIPHMGIRNVGCQAKRLNVTPVVSFPRSELREPDIVISA